MLIYIITIIIILWLTLFIGYNFGAWKIRKNLMKKFAQKMNLNFDENYKYKTKKCFKIGGLYKNKNISIEELLYLYPKEPSLTSVNYKSEHAEILCFPVYRTMGVTYKRVIITVDNKIIYNKDKDYLLPRTNKIQKIIDKYIESGKISKTDTLNKIGLIILICTSLIPLIYIFINFILN
ncbi:MAG TPA: hypothetical protein PKL13_01440 [bacterium]|nr:hypothetical protein [bacterium]